jgi:protein ImuB
MNFPMRHMFACIYIPDFPVEAIVRAEPLLRERAVAVLEGKPPQVRVVAVNEPARLLGLEPGMTKLQAAQLNIPQSGTTNGQLRRRSPAQENAAHAGLLDVSHAFSPRVEDAAPDTLLLDLAGLERLYGSPAAMGSNLKSRVTAVGLESNIAVAANPNAALHAARGFDGITIIAPGREAQRLGVLPVQILLDTFEISSPNFGDAKASPHERAQLHEQMLDTLERWGVRDFRTLGLLPEHALTSRLGQTGAQLRRLARGEGVRTLALCDPPTQFEEAMDLESPVETIESLSFVLNRLLEQLCARLETRALAAQELHLRLQLEPRVADEQTTSVAELNGPAAESHNVIVKPEFERVLRLPVSMRDGKVFLKLLQLDLSAHPPGAPVSKVWIAAEPAPPRSAQRGLFLPITPEPEKLEITLARINAIVGERRAGIARLLDSHRRDSFRVDRFVSANDEFAKSSTATTWDIKATAMAMRLIRPSCRVKVQILEGKPAFLASGGTLTANDLQGRVVWSAGPWRSSGDWWTENANSEAPSGAWDREEWDIALEIGDGGSAHGDNRENQKVTLYRIYRDIETGHWFADASYD